MYKIGMAALMAIAVSCSHDRQQVSSLQEEANESPEEAVQSTLFTENTEFYVEYDPLTVGEESIFLVHVTDLQTYRPQLSGQLTIELEGTSVSSPKPDRPGIFEVTLVPQVAGEFQITYRFQSGQLLAIATAIADVHDGEAAEEHDHSEAETGEISFLKEQAWKSEFMVLETMPASFSPVIHTGGEILAVPGAKNSVVSPGSGMISFAYRNLVQGSRVTRGELLFTVSDEAIIENNLQLQYQEALNEFEMSRSEYGRHRELFRKGAISERQYISTRTKYAADSLKFHNLAVRMSEKGLQISAPITGIIHELNVTDGAYAETGLVMATISSNRELMIRADLPQQYFNQLSSIETAHFRPAYSAQVYSVDELNGKLLAAGSTVAENDHYLPVIFEVKNDGSLLEGAFTEVYLITSEKSEALVLPVTAILEEQGTHFIYVQVTGESYTKRRIITGGNDGRFVEILDGLLPGERVVTQGTMLLKAATLTTGVASHDHSH